MPSSEHQSHPKVPKFEQIDDTYWMASVPLPQLVDGLIAQGYSVVSRALVVGGLYCSSEETVVVKGRSVLNLYAQGTAKTRIRKAFPEELAGTSRELNAAQRINSLRDLRDL